MHTPGNSGLSHMPHVCICTKAAMCTKAAIEHNIRLAESDHATASPAQKSMAMHVRDSVTKRYEDIGAWSATSVFIPDVRCIKTEDRNLKASFHPLHVQEMTLTRVHAIL